MGEWKPGTVFMRHVDKKGDGYIGAHACWNMDTFIESQRAAATKEGGSIEVVTQADYLASKRGTSNG